MKKTRKNNKTPYLVVTVACALLAAGLGGATLAKYITEKSTDSTAATVAKWGYVISLDATDLFVSDYELPGGTGTVATKAAGDTGLSVDGSSDRVAPGTTGSMTFSVIGTAEVSSKITFAATGTDVYYDATDAANDEYYPIVWTLVKDDQSAANADYNVSGKLSEIVAKLNGETKENAPGTVVNSTYTLSWTWAFAQEKDTLDTYLGNIAAGSGETGSPKASSTKTQFKLDIKVEQTQK